MSRPALRPTRVQRLALSVLLLGGLALLVLAYLRTPAGSTERPAPGRTPDAPAVVSGPARVLDGDTLDITGTRVRLYGIDAPEHDQTCVRAGRVYACGQEATAALRGLIGTHAVNCRRRDTDRYGRTVAVCSVGGTDVNGWMALQGHALAYRAYSADYVPQEDAARKAKRGLHAGTYVNPADFRRGGSTATSPATSPDAVSPAGTSRPAPYASCAQARAAGPTPILRGAAGYNPKLDGDHDGRMCETRR